MGAKHQWPLKRLFACCPISRSIVTNGDPNLCSLSYAESTKSDQAIGSVFTVVPIIIIIMSEQAMDTCCSAICSLERQLWEQQQQQQSLHFGRFLSHCFYLSIHPFIHLCISIYPRNVSFIRFGETMPTGLLRQPPIYDKIDQLSFADCKLASACNCFDQLIQLKTMSSSPITMSSAGR